MLADLLTPEEEQVDLRTGALRFDIDVLSGRVAALTDWLVAREELAHLGVGLFGASTGAAVLVTAAARPASVEAIVRGATRPLTPDNGSGAGLVTACQPCARPESPG